MPRMKQPTVHARNSYAEIELRSADNTCEGAGVAQKTNGEKKKKNEGSSRRYAEARMRKREQASTKTEEGAVWAWVGGRRRTAVSARRSTK